MIKNFCKITNITANSVIDGVVTVSMRATVSENGTWNIAKTIRNPEAYLTNQEQCKKDYEEFEAELLKIAQE